MDTEELVPGDHTIPTENNPSRDIDLTLFTYLHPALIGRLPIAWLATDQKMILGSSEQPRRLIEAREEQRNIQAQLWKRVVGKQRIGISDMDEGDIGEADNGDDPFGEARSLLGEGRRPEVGVYSRVRSFIDGMSSWAHLQMQ